MSKVTTELKKLYKDKILFWDLETSLIEVYTHYIGSKVSINNNAIKRDKKIICVSYKAEGWDEAKTLYWDKNQDDRTLLEKFTKIAEKYPVLVAQNGDAFDLKVFKGRLWIEQLPPLTNVVTLDTLKMSRSNFRLTSHKLDYKSKAIGRSGKIRMEFQDWVDIQERLKSPREKMGPYNRVDVDELQEVFWSMLPYVDKLPAALGPLIGSTRDDCLKCGAKPQLNGVRYTAAGIPRNRYRCVKCGHNWTGTRDVKKEVKK